MKIHAIYGYDLPTTGATGSGNSSLYTRFPNGPWQSLMTNSECSMAVTASAAGVVTMSITANQYQFGNYRFKMNANLKEMVPALTPTSNLFIGVNLTAGAGYQGSHLFGLTSDQDLGNATALLFTNEVPGFVLNKAYNFECNLDFPNNIIRRRLDGKPLSNMTMPAWMATAVSATPGALSVFVAIGHLGSYSIQQSQNHQFLWSDFYCIEWEAGELPQFLGAVKVAKVPVAAVAASAWTPSTGTPTSVLQSGYRPSIPITAPTVTSDDAMTPASITYDVSSLPVNAVITGVLVKGRSAITAAATGNLGISLTTGGVETPDTNVAMVAAQTFYDRLYSSNKNPAGLAWTLPSLAGLTVKAKPKV